MNTKQLRLGLLSGLGGFAGVFLMCTSARADSLLLNGDFATGTLADWTVFTTPDGTNGVGLPDIASFDTTGTGASNAAHFDVGAVTFDNTEQGGGLSQSVTVATAGLYTFSADVASEDDANGEINSDGGVFSILIDGSTLASINLGSFTSSLRVLMGTLSGSTDLTAGSHTFAIEITRNFISLPGGAAPDEYVDNLTLNGPVVPEPSSVLLLSSGLLFLVVRWRRSRL